MDPEVSEVEAPIADEVDNTSVDTTDTGGKEPSLEEQLRATFRKSTETQPRVNGRFAAKAATVEGEPEVATTETTEGAEQQTQQPVVDDKLTAPPKSWRDDEKAEWDKLTPKAREAVHRREEDMHRGLNQYRGMAQIGQTLDKVIQPYAEEIRQSGFPAQEIVSNLFQTARALKNPETGVQTLLQIARTNGISIDQLVQANSQAPVVTDPALEARLRAVEEDRQRERQEAEQAKQAEYDQKAQKFFADPKNVHANAVRAEMQGLLAQGLAETLEEAYDKACQLKPEIRQKLQAAQQAEQARKSAEVAAAARRASSANVVRRGAHPAPVPNSTLDDQLRSVYRKRQGSG